ncbi:hypothetical protein BC828DRAFT_374047 [Blastocladiella britannica]|nr:hypothetical protein BC828DRAFT_374047 [Blastocladiella britannica]
MSSSPSPPRSRARGPPPPPPEHGPSVAPPRFAVTALDLQRQEVAKLMARPDVAIKIDRKVHTLRDELAPPKDFNSNVQGSSAGAGSGDFHVYRAHRRRELLRQKLMDDDLVEDLAEKEHQAKVAAAAAAAAERTAKRRAKRTKRKANAGPKAAVKKSTNTGTTAAAADEDEDEEEDGEQSGDEGDRDAAAAPPTKRARTDGPSD